MRRKFNLSKKLIPLSLSVAMLAATPGLALATVDGYVTQGATQTYYYSYSDLKASLLAYLVNPDAPAAALWKHFIENKKSILALHDTENGYVSFNDVKDALTQALIAGTEFDVNAYTEGDDAEPATLPDTFTEVTLGDDGIIDEEEVPTDDQTYDNLKAEIGAKVAAYVALADGNLTTQALVDAAKAAGALVDLTGLNDVDKSTAQAIVDAAAAKVTAAQTVITANAKIEADAAAAVKAYEDAPITTLAEIATAEGLKAPAVTAVDLVKTDATKVALTAKIAAQDAVIAAKKVVLSTLAVSSVSANNLKTATVAFNKAIDATTVNSTNVKVYVNTNLVTVDGAATATTVAAGNVGYIVSADKATLNLVFGTKLAQSDKVKVELNGVKASTGEALTGYSNTVTAIDTVLPSITSVAMENPKTMTVQFSEPADYSITPAQILTTIKVDGIAAIASVTPNYVTNKLTVSFPTALAAGSHTILLAGIPDFANFKNADQTFTVNVTADTTAPVMTTAVASNRDKIRVTFDEAVTTVGTFKVNGVAVTSVTPVTGTSSQFDLALASSLDLSAIVEISVKYKDQADVLGNTVTTEQELKFSVADDKVVPTVTAQLLTDSAKKNDVTFTFTKSMQTALGTITVKDKDSKVVKTLTQPWTFKTGTNNTVLELTATQLGLGSVNIGNYTVNVKDFKDNTIRQNAIAETNLAVTAIDTLAPTVNTLYTAVAGATTATDKVTFYFSEAMDATTLNNLSNYAIVGGSALSSVTGASVSSIATDSKSVTLVVPNAVASNPTIQVYSLKDVAGNLITAQNVTKSLATSLNVSSATATSTSVVKVVFGAPIAQVDPGSFQLTTTAAGHTTLNFANAVLDTTDATNKTVLLTVNGSMLADANYTLANTTTTSLTKDSYGNALNAATATVLIDKIAPIVKSASVVAGTKTINATVAADGKSGTIDLSGITGNVTTLTLTATEGGTGYINPAGTELSLTSANGVYTFTIPTIPGDTGNDGISLPKLQALATLDYDNNANTLTVVGDLYDAATPSNRTPLTLTITVK